MKSILKRLKKLEESAALTLGISIAICSNEEERELYAEEITKQHSQG